MKKTNVLTKLVGGLTILATVVASTASAWIFYQPQEPKNLQ